MNRIQFRVILSVFLFILFLAATGAQADTGSAESNIITVDTTDPTDGTIAIDGGVALTKSASVTLTLAVSDAGGLSQMQLSNNGTIWSALETYNTTKNWTLSSGNGQKTVYAKFKDNAGNWSTSFLTTITLEAEPGSAESNIITVDTTDPTDGTIAIDGGVALTKSATVTLTLAASDAGGLSQMQFSTEGRFGAPPRPAAQRNPGPCPPVMDRKPSM